MVDRNLHVTLCSECQTHSPERDSATCSYCKRSRRDHARVTRAPRAFRLPKDDAAEDTGRGLGRFPKAMTPGQARLQARRKANARLAKEARR